MLYKSISYHVPAYGVQVWRKSIRFDQYYVFKAGYGQLSWDQYKPNLNTRTQQLWVQSSRYEMQPKFIT
jgi:hypothetical protein